MMKRRLQVTALILVAAAATVVVLVPLATEVTADSDGNETTTAVSLLQAMGPSVLLIAGIPMVIAALPLLSRGRRSWIVLSIASAALLWVFVVLAMLSIGVFFIPGAIVALIAACIPVASARQAPAATT